jgi:hypothetical protein
MVPAFHLPINVDSEDGDRGSAVRLRATQGDRLPMQVKPLLSHILQDDALTRGLADPEARMLVEWLVDRAERMSQTSRGESVVWGQLKGLCRRARAIGRFVSLWCYARERGAAVQLAGAEKFAWPLPTRTVDPCELMQEILTCEDGSSP